MDIHEIEYTPNIMQLFETFEKWEGNYLPDIKPSDQYLLTILSLGMLTEGNGRYVPGTKWHGFLELSVQKKYRMFLYNIKDLPVYDTILNILSENVTDIEGLMDALSPRYSKTTVLTVVSWMESLHVIELRDGKYFESSTEEYDDIADDQEIRIREFSELNIQEFKYSIYEIARQIKQGKIILQPEFQRNLVWRQDQKNRFIESVLLDLPLPPIYLKKQQDGKQIVIDGLQRLSTLISFMNNEFPLKGLESLSVYNDSYFDAIDDKKDGSTARIENKQIYFYVLPSTVSLSVVYDIFNRINTGGTQLTRQEIRNCIYQGKATLLLKKISENSIFRDSIDNGISSLRMKDREAILRCIAFVILDFENDYNGSMDDFLEKALVLLGKMSEGSLKEIEQRSLAVFKLTNEVFGKANFRIPTKYSRGRVNIALMESIFYAFYKFVHKDANHAHLKDKITLMLQDNTYVNSVRWTTANKNQVKTRFSYAKKHLG